MTIDGIAHNIHETAVSKGFWDANTGEDHTIFYLSKLALVHSEVSEVLEAVRKQKGSKEVVKEISDIIVRTLDLWSGMFRDGYVTESLDETLGEIMAANMARPHMHGVLA